MLRNKPAGGQEFEGRVWGGHGAGGKSNNAGRFEYAVLHADEPPGQQVPVFHLNPQRRLHGNHISGFASPRVAQRCDAAGPSHCRARWRYPSRSLADIVFCQTRPEVVAHNLAYLPCSLIWPASSQIPLWQSVWIAIILWLTKSTVRPSFATLPIFPKHFFWNSASPTASTSSTIKISGSKCAATANARRTYMPLE